MSSRRPLATGNLHPTPARRVPVEEGFCASPSSRLGQFLACGRAEVIVGTGGAFALVETAGLPGLHRHYVVDAL